jgi:osomolarity two-component system response regulator SSK1
MFLKKKKIKYDTAKDGREAVDKWRTGGFHLILVGAASYFGPNFS